LVSRKRSWSKALAARRQHGPRHAVADDAAVDEVGRPLDVVLAHRGGDAGGRRPLLLGPEHRPGEGARAGVQAELQALEQVGLARGADVGVVALLVAPVGRDLDAGGLDEAGGVRGLEGPEGVEADEDETLGRVLLVAETPLLVLLPARRWICP
jgi:hypothetical protein